MRAKRAGGRLFLPAVAVLLFYLTFGAVAGLDEGLLELGDAIVSDEGAKSAAAKGAGSLADYVRNENASLFEGLALDATEVLRVLDAVEAYNERMQRERIVSYEYASHHGMVVSFDEFTGEVTVTGYETKEDSQRQVATRRVRVGVERVPTSHTKEELDGMAKRLGGAAFTPPPAYFERPVYVTEPIYEKVTESKWHEPETKVLTDSVTLSRRAAECPAKEILEDPWNLDWRPVLALCSMMAGEREEGEGGGITADMVSRAISFLGCRYEYVCDPTDPSHDGSLAAFSAETRSYRLIVTGDPRPGEVSDFTVRRVPAIAPLLVGNGYLSYLYEYAPLGGGAYELVKRTARVDGDLFAKGAGELVPDFDAGLFAELVSFLPDGEELSAYYGELSKGACFEEIAELPEECPSIGIRVKCEGSLSSKTDLPFFGAASGTLTPSWEPSAKALGDESFACMWEAVRECLGTKYVLSGNGGPGESFDCSSFAAYVLKCGGHAVNAYPEGRESTFSLLGSHTGITKSGKVTEIEAPEPGDLIFFRGTMRERDPSYVSHVAIYLGEGMMAHASARRGGVVVESVEGSGLMEEHFLCFGRPK